MVRAMLPLSAEVDDAAARLARTLPLHPLVARVLARRGYADARTAGSFLSPMLAEMSRPDAMADRDAAADRLARAARNGERVVVFGDYDVDGLTSTALLTRVLRTLGAEVIPRVASRFDGGYGLSATALARALDDGPAVLVTCDCGTSDHERLAEARRRGVDCVVIDHHKVPDEPLPAFAFLNPHRPDCGSTFKHMASVGLAFSVGAAVRQRLGHKLDMRAFLDLVALGTVADVAPLHGDNRTLTRHGIARIDAGDASPGVRALKAAAKLRYAMTARDVSFSLAPMLNAPGRLGSPQPTLDLLLSADDAEAAPRAAALAAANTRRKELSAALVETAFAQARTLYGDAPSAGVVVAGEGWHAGMGGIVAGRLAERLGTAVCVIAVENGVGVGSVRAPRGTKLYDAVRACSGLLETFGGHDAAAGLSLRASQVDAFRAAFAEAVRNAGGAAPEPVVTDGDLSEGDLDATLADGLRALEPTGEGNPEVLVRVRGARLAEVRSIQDQHLRLGLAVGRRRLPAFLRDGVALRALGSVPPERGLVDVVGALRLDPWSGPAAVQVDVRTITAAG